MSESFAPLSFNADRSSISRAMQTPNIMRWARQIEECLEVLEIHPANLASDKIICSHIRLQHILEDVEGQLRSSVLGPTAMKVTYRAFRRQLADWASSIDIWNGTTLALTQTERVLISDRTTSAIPSIRNALPARDGNVRRVTTYQPSTIHRLHHSRPSLTRYFPIPRHIFHTHATHCILYTTHTRHHRIGKTPLRSNTPYRSCRCGNTDAEHTN
jgi:hypothetical protein